MAMSVRTTPFVITAVKCIILIGLTVQFWNLIKAYRATHFEGIDPADGIWYWCRIGWLSLLWGFVAIS